MTESRAQTIDRDCRSAITKRHVAWLPRGLDYLYSHEAMHLDSDATDDLRISLLPLEWEAQNSIDPEPRFSQPLDLDRVDQMYKRSRAQGYHDPRNPWGTWMDENDENDLHHYSRRLLGARNAAFYVSGVIGHVDEPLHIAAESDWMLCPGVSRYQQVDIDFHLERKNFLRYLYFYRALPWPQRELPSDPELIKQLENKVQRTSCERWGTVVDPAIRRPGQKPKVHLGVLIGNDCDPCNGKLLRNEVAVAARAMYDQLRQRRNHRDHVIFPVFVYAFAGKHVRFLQVHIDPVEHRLVIRKTSYIHIAGPESVEEIKLLVSWMLAKPIGETRFDELQLNPEDLHETDLKDEPRSPRKRPTAVSRG